MHTGLNAFADEEPFLIRRIKYRLQLIESLEAHHGGTFYGLATSGSELAGDDALMGHLQTSHLVAHCLSVSLDALRTSRFVLQDPKVDGGLRIPMIGHYAILRTAVEAAALAVWLMRPDDRTARLTRSLQARWDDIIHDDQMVHVLTGPLEGDSKQETSTKQHQRRENALRVRRLKNDLRQFAKAAQIPEEDFNRGLAGFGPIIADASMQLGVKSTHARGAWHFVSGLTHPSVSRSLLASKVETPTGDEGDVVHARFIADPQSVKLALDSAFLMHISALSLAARRGSNPSLEWSPGSEDPLPPRRSQKSNG